MNLKEAEEAKTEVQEVLAQSPRAHGFETSRWTIDLIQEAIHWLKDCTKAGAWHILKRLGLTRKQALEFVRSPDPDFRLKVGAIKRAFSHALAQPEQAALLFEDELSYYQQPRATTAWAPTGPQQLRVSHGVKGNKMTRIGAVMDGITGQVIYHQGNKFGVRQMKALYRAIRQQYDQPKVFVVQDNWHQVHNHPEALETADHLDIIPLFLPTYASWLNPIEKLWRWLRQDLLYHHPWANELATLRSQVAAFLDQFLQGSDDLLYYCGLLPS